MKEGQVGYTHDGISSCPLELNSTVCLKVDETGDAILSKLDQFQEDKYYVFSYLCSVDFTSIHKVMYVYVL